MILSPKLEKKNPKKCHNLEIFSNSDIHYFQTNKCYQYEFVNMNFFDTNFMLGILQQTKEFSSHTLILSPKIEKKKNKTKKYQNLEVFPNFNIHDFGQRNAINMIFFYTNFMLGILQQSKEFSSHTIHQIR